MDAFNAWPDEAEIHKERRKARELRQTRWWKNRCAKGKCHYCGRPVSPGDLTMDHIVPLIRGGKSTKGNTVACCKACNSNKKYLLPMEWDNYLKGFSGSS